MVGNKLALEIKAAEVLWPETWRRVYQRHIEGPGSHYPFKTAAACMVNAVEGYTHGIQTHATAAISCAAAVLDAYQYPVYFVGSELLAAIKNTNPPVGMTWEQMKLPQTAAVYQLPVGALQEGPGVDVLFIGYAWVEKGKQYQVPGYPGYKVEASVDKLIVFWASYDKDKLAANDCTIMSTQTLAPEADWISNQSAVYRDKRQDEGSTLLETWDLPTDAEFAAYLCGLLANLILVQTARPELVEEGQATGKRIKAQGGLPCYSPNFIGKGYHVRREHGLSQGGHFTELRWRAGHYKMQRHGAGRAQVKTVWIEPYLARSAGLVRA